MSGPEPARNRPVLITGCQRSGTTLLHLILDSHPRIRGVDEDEYDDARREQYLGDPAFGPIVCFKLPRVAWNAAYIRGFAGVLPVWCVRDPRDVVSSMLRLELPIDGGGSVAWAAHPHGAEYELHFAVPALARAGETLDGSAARRLADARRCLPARRTREQQVFLAALCWAVKNRLLAAVEAVLEPHVIVYERLVREPEPTLRELLGRIGAPWDDRVVRHHRLQRGVSIGGTDNTRPIDTASTGRWRTELGTAEAELVASLCSPTAERFGYRW